MNYWPRVCWLRPSIFHKCRPNLATNNKVSFAKWSSNRSLFCFLLKQKWNEISTNLPVCLWCTHYWPRVWRLRHSTFHKCWPKFWQLKIKFQMQMQAQTWIYFVFFWNKNETKFHQIFQCAYDALLTACLLIAAIHFSQMLSLSAQNIKVSLPAWANWKTRPPFSPSYSSMFF